MKKIMDEKSPRGSRKMWCLLHMATSLHIYAVCVCFIDSVMGIWDIDFNDDFKRLNRDE